ncbi:MAG: RAMP superfamily CRISPR-associated protein [Salinibacter sp.]
MQTRLLTVALESPLAVSSGRGTSNRTSTPSVIPPQTLRGAMAAALDRAGCDDETMQSVFGPTGCRTSALVPFSRSQTNGEDQTPRVQSRPAPLTLRTCKRYEGFLGEDPDGETHGVEDTLFASLRLELEGDPEGMERLRACAREGCGNVLTQMDGLVCGAEKGYVTQPEPDRRTQTHVGIDRRRDGAAPGILYAREVISEETAEDPGLAPTRFRARVAASEEDMAALDGVLGEEGAELRVGTSISRGLGRCRVERFEEAGEGPTVRERVRDFNDVWKERTSGAAEEALVALTLETPGLFVDEFLRPDTTPEGSALLQAARPDEGKHAEALSEMDRVHEIARPYRFQAWNGLAGFPHATDQGIRAGSVLVYSVPEITPDLEAALEHIEDVGIGLRRELGLGRLRVCDPIHTEVHEHTAGA